MRISTRTAAGAIAGALALAAVAAPATAAPPDQWWSDVYDLDEVHQTTQGEGVTVCVVDGAINAEVPEFDGADLQLKAASVGKRFGSELGEAKSYPHAFYADHGTSMSSLIIGQGTGTGPGGSGIAGVAPQATVYFYGANPDLSADDSNPSAFAPLIDRGLDDGCEIFSISFTGIRMTAPTMERLNESKAIVLWGGPLDPATFQAAKDIDGTLVIGAANPDGQPWDDERQPELPDLIAPGVDIISGGMVGTATDARWDSSIVNSGSSDAVAITAGLLALVKAKYPGATGNQLIQSLLHSVGGENYWGAKKDIGWGTVRLADMLERDPTGWPDVNPMLMDRQEIFDTFPESAWRDPDAPATDEPRDRTNASAEATTTPASDDNGLPAWAWAVGALVLIGAAGTTVILVRRRSTPPTGTGA